MNEVNRSISPFSKYKKASWNKRLYSVLLDFLILLVLNLFIFVGIAKLIGDNLPSVKDKLNTLDEINIKANEETIRSHLIEYDTNNNQLETKEIIDNIIKRALKSSLIYYNIETYNSYDDYKSLDTIEYLSDSSNDNLYYYYNIYRFNNENYNNSNEFIGFKKYYVDILKVKDYFNLELINDNKESYFNLDITNALSSYYFDNDEYYLETYENIHNLYLSSYNEAILDYQNNNNLYISYVNSFNDLYNSYINSILIELFISYFISIVLTYFLPYFIFKNYLSFGDKILKLPSINFYLESPKISSILLKNLLELLLNLFILVIIVFLSFGNLGLITYTFSIFNLLSLAIFSLCLMICSLIISFINKNKCFLSDYVARLIKVDEKELIKEDED